MALFNIGDAVLTLSANTQGLNKSLGDAQKKFNSSFGNIAKAAKAVRNAMIGIGAGLVAGAAIALREMGRFDHAMRSANTMLKKTGPEFDKLKDEVLELSSSMGIDATEAAEALYQAVSASVPEENLLDFLKVAGEAAIGGVTDTKTAVDGLTNVLNAFKIPASEVSRVSDVMFTTVARGKTTFGELSQSMFNVAPVAAAAGIGFAEVAASLASMTKQGIPTSVATTQLRQAIISIEKPSATMAEVIEKAGFASGTAMLEALGLQGTLETLTGSAEGNKEMMFKMFGSTEAAAAAIALTGENSVIARQDLIAMKNSTGEAKSAFEEMEGSMSHRAKVLRESFDAVKIKLGEALIPTLERIAPHVEKIVKSMGEWVEANPKLIESFADKAAWIAAGGALMGLAVPLGMIHASLVAIAAAGGAGWAFGRWIDNQTDKMKQLNWQLRYAAHFIEFITGEKLASFLGGIVGGLGSQAGLVGPASNRALVGPDSSYNAYATGTNFHPGGMAWVGERGPELVNLPRGSQVFDAQTSSRMMGEVKINMQVNVSPGMPFDAEREATNIQRAISRVRSRRGGF